MKTITTIHTVIGYTNNIEIIEAALKAHFGFDDNSHILTAVAAHIWAVICGQGEEKQWGEPEVMNAIAQCQLRLQKMNDQMRCTRKGCAVSYPHVKH